MQAQLYHIEDADTDRNKIIQAAEVIKNGGTVIFPTETVYGLGANGLDTDAAKKIYEAKGRPSDNPLILHVSDYEMLKSVVSDFPKKAEKLAESFWPGPLTMILYKAKIVPDTVTGGLNTVAVRMPSNPIAQALIKESGVPIAAPSANISGRPSITDWEFAVDEMKDRVDVILLSEPSKIGLESTIIDLSVETPVILRPGFIGQSEIESKIGKIVLSSGQVSSEDVPKAPGMKYTHYSPRAEVYIAPKNTPVEKIIEFYNKNKEKNPVIFVLRRYINNFYGCAIHDMGENTVDAAKVFFRALRQADKAERECIIICDMAYDEMGSALMNRAFKAAGGKIIE